MIAPAGLATEVCSRRVNKVPDPLDELVIATLTQDGREVSDWFFIGESICFWGRYGDIGDWLTSDDRLSAALESYLHRMAAPVFESAANARLRTNRCPYSE